MSSEERPRCGRPSSLAPRVTASSSVLAGSHTASPLTAAASSLPPPESRAASLRCSRSGEEVAAARDVSAAGVSFRRPPPVSRGGRVAALPFFASSPPTERRGGGLLRGVPPLPPPPRGVALASRPPATRGDMGRAAAPLGEAGVRTALRGETTPALPALGLTGLPAHGEACSGSQGRASERHPASSGQRLVIGRSLRTCAGIGIRRSLGRCLGWLHVARQRPGLRPDRRHASVENAHSVVPAGVHALPSWFIRKL